MPLSDKDCNGPHATLVERVAPALPQKKVEYTLHIDKTNSANSWFFVVLTYHPLPHVATPADRPDGAAVRTAASTDALERNDTGFWVSSRRHCPHPRQYCMSPFTQGRAQGGGLALRCLSNVYDQWVDVAEQELVTTTGMESRGSGKGRHGLLHVTSPAVDVGCSAGQSARQCAFGPKFIRGSAPRRRPKSSQFHMQHHPRNLLGLTPGCSGAHRRHSQGIDLHRFHSPFSLMMHGLAPEGQGCSSSCLQGRCCCVVGGGRRGVSTEVLGKEEAAGRKESHTQWTTSAAKAA